ncbi:MAG: VCBS repeat-containing protein, partial [Planctomycetes bacterium]|nr:VCBS repeat-containing protein [Planctomycetota bacterium]
GPAGQGPTRIVHAEGTYVYDALLLDLDGDGADEVVGLTFAHLVALRSNQTITRHAFGTTLWNPSRLERAELTGDAQDDFVVVGNREAYLYGWVSGGIVPYGVFWHQLFEGYEQSSIDAGDIDGDGDQDLVAFEKRQTNSLARYRVLYRTGPNFWSLGSIQSGPPATQLVDLDRDGALDLVGYVGSFHSSGPTNFPVNAGLGFFSFAFGDGQGGFGAMQQLLSAGATTLAGIGDLDADGDLDLVAGRAVYYARGSLRTTPIPQLVFANPSERELADAEGDGDLDLFVGLGANGYQRNDLDAGFQAATPLVLGAAAGETLSGPGFPGDFDADGDADLVVRGVIPGRAATWRFLRNHGGTFHVEGDAAPVGVDLSYGSFEARDSHVADLDGDGLLDLVTLAPTGLFSSSTSSKLWRQVPGTTPSFQLLQQYADRRVAWIGRVDPDALLDVVLVRVQPGALPRSFDTHVSVRLGVGGGAFGVEQPLAVLPTTSQPTLNPNAADFDGDGDIDFVLAGNLFHLNQSTLGAVSFATTWFNALPGSLLYAPTGGFTYRAIDLDGDAWTDLAMMASSAGFDLLRRVPGTPFGAGGYTLESTQLFPLGSTVDADNDGDADQLGAAYVRNARFHGASRGGVRTFGASSAGTGGARPTLSIVGPVRVGSAAELRLVGAAGGSASFLAVGTSETALANVPSPGLTYYVGNTLGLFGPFVNNGPSGVAGAGSFRIPHVVDPSYVGVTLFEQVLIVDVGVPSFWVASNALEVRYR